MTSSRLRPLFLRTLSASLASPLMLAGCGGLDLSDYAAPACENKRLAVSGLSPTEPVDFVQLRAAYPSAPGGSPQFSVVSSSGTACATATRKDACEQALAALAPATGFNPAMYEVSQSYYLATTRGDEVAARASLEALQGFLGPINTTQEAVLLAFARGYDVSCTQLGRGGVKANANGTFNVIATQGFACGEGTKVERFVLEVSSEGETKQLSSEVLERGTAGCAVGRRPEGLRGPDAVPCDEALGQFFASAAHLEAASILAFLRLSDELALHGADAALRDAALASAADEVLHTDATTRLAQRFGATPPRPVVSDAPPRSLFDLALDNAVEGCTRETYGALVAHHQALHAGDEQVRAALARIAEDETRHAELSWDIERWAAPRLTDAERAQLREARREAIAALREEVSVPLAPELVTRAGLPTPEVARALLDTLARELWA